MAAGRIGKAPFGALGALDAVLPDCGRRRSPYDDMVAIPIERL